MDSSMLYEAHTLVARASTDPTRPPVYKVIGLCLAVASGLLIGTSFVLKKIGLLRANAKYNEEAGEGYGYLKNAFWWGGMTLMIMGEICNFVAYAFVDAILVTPLGALSVVVTTILSAIFLKERLSFVGKIGCFNCIIGSVVIVLNAPEQSAVADIQEMKHYVISPGFLSYAGVIILASAFIALWAGPRYGKKSMLVYLSVCSLIGGLSVVATQGLGSAIVAQAGGKPQFNQWFLYVLLVFVITTLVTEIIYLNKALNLFNAALVTPTYYVLFTSATIVTSAILFRGFKGTAISITTVIMGFLQICAGVVLLQLSKSAKDVPDAAVFKGDLNQVREVAEQEQPETEPKADAIRGAAGIIRRLSTARQAMEQREFQRLRTEKSQDLEPLRENEVVEWDGLRRRRTVIGDMPNSPLQRRRTIHPPLGMSSFPEENVDENDEDDGSRHDPNHSGVFDAIRDRASTLLHIPGHRHNDRHDQQSPMHPVALTNINIQPTKLDTPGMPYETVDTEEAREHVLGLPEGLRKSDKDKKRLFSPRSKPLPPQPEPSPGLSAIPGARRQFSFTNFIRHTNRTPVNDGTDELPPPTRSGLASRGSSYSHEQKKAMKNATEEERLGLVKGDSSRLLESSPERPPVYPMKSHYAHSNSSSSVDDYQDHPRGRGTSDSDNDDEWQMTHLPVSMTATSIATAKQLPNSSNIRYQESQASSSRKRPSSPRTSSQNQPSLPPHYQTQHTRAQPNQYATASQKPILDPLPAPSSHFQPVPVGIQIHNVPEEEQSTVKQAVHHSGHSRNLSTSRTQYQITNPVLPRILDREIEQEPESDDDESIVNRGRSAYTNTGEGWSGGNTSNEDDSEKQRKFKEQSQREREKRRQRMSVGGALPSPQVEYPERRL